MQDYSVDENLFLVHAFVLGIFITFVYDLLRILRRILPHGSFWVSLEDLFFWGFCALRVFLLMYHEGNGTLRWFAILGALLGMLLYRETVSRFLVQYLSVFLSRILGFVWRPFRFAGGKMAAVGQNMVNRIRRRLISIKKRRASEKVKSPERKIPQKRSRPKEKSLKREVLQKRSPSKEKFFKGEVPQNEVFQNRSPGKRVEILIKK